MKNLFWSAVFLFFLPSQAQEKWMLDAKKSFITYDASHFLHEWTGTNKNLKGLMIEDEDSFQKIAIAMYVRDFDSKNSNRDNNAFEILEVLRFPKIEFFSDHIETKDNELKFIGGLNFHGTELTKNILAKSTFNNKKIELEGDFNLNLSDFEVPLPSFMMRKMEDEIVINFQLHFKKLER